MANGFDWKTLQDPKRTAKHVSDTSALIASLMHLDDAKLETRTSNYKTINDLATAIDVSIVTHSAQIDPFKIYCNITGREIGTRSEESMRFALQIHGAAKVEELIQYSAQGAIAEHWIATAGRDLSRLAEIDPYGYFVYAASKAFTRHYHNLVQQNEAKNAEYLLQMLKQKIVLFKLISKFQPDEIVRANEAWRNFLSLIDPHFAKGSIVFPCQTLIDFGTPQIVKFLQERLTRLIAEMIYQKTRYKGRVSNHDVVRLTEEHRGLSNFRAQARLSGENEGDFMARFIAENANDFKHDGIIDYGSSWQRHEPKKKPKYDGETHTITGAFTLKLGASQTQAAAKITVIALPPKDAMQPTGERKPVFLSMLAKQPMK